jgi:hypothetical protein
MKYFVVALSAFHLFHLTCGFSFFQSGLQKIVKTNAVVASLIDNIQIGMFSDKLLLDITNVNIGNTDVMYLLISGVFLYSQILATKNIKIAKFANIDDFKETKKIMTQIIFILYCIFWKGIDNAI